MLDHDAGRPILVEEPNVTSVYADQVKKLADLGQTKLQGLHGGKQNGSDR